MAKENNKDFKANEAGASLPEVQNELSKVASNPKQSIFIVVVICGIFIYIFFNLFINNKNSADGPAPLPQIIAKPVQQVEQPQLSIPSLPSPPVLEAPIAILPPPVVEQPAAPVILPPAPPLAVKPDLPEDAILPTKLLDNDEEKRRKEMKRKSSIILLGGTETKKPEEQAEQAQQEATFVDRGNMDFVLARGKIITAVVETAINTDFGGEVKAVINRDVYSEKEKIILIPKGSKVFGSYGNGVDSSGRVSIIWTRVDLSNGYVINLQGATTDELGRPGAQGRLDNKFKERIANAVLISAFNIGFAQALDKVIAPPINSQAAAANTEVATNIQNLALQVYADNNTYPAEDLKIAGMCQKVQDAITDKTSSAYTKMLQACNTAQYTTIGALPNQRINALISAVNNAAASLLTTGATASTPTQAQKASEQAFKDVSSTVKGMLNQQFKATVTIDQGTIIKIYVNKDYKFPKNVLQKSRLMR